MTFRRHLLMHYHNSPVSGHRGRDKTNHELGRDWWWPGMYEEARDHCAHCALCKAERGLSGVSAWTRTELYSRPFRVLQFDTVTTKTDGAKQGTQYLLTVVCCFHDGVGSYQFQIILMRPLLMHWFGCFWIWQDSPLCCVLITQMSSC